VPARKGRRDPPDWLAFLEPNYPGANMVLLQGEHPIVVDTGFGSNLPETEELLRGAGSVSEELALIVNTHYHCDHVGGNSGLQRRYGTPIAAHRWDADLANRRDREVRSAEWLHQPVESYRVDRPLSGGDEIKTGSVSLRLLHTSGHTLGHISLYEPEERVLILGGAVHKDDVAWINPFREGVGVLHKTLETLDKLVNLPVDRAYSGYGPAIDNLAGTIQGARQRYTK
jgi:hydroxyacylglutathione hydrolase